MDYEKMYQSYYMQVYSYVVTLTRNREQAEEITQNTFYKAITAKHPFRGNAEELTYLCSIAKNLFYDEKRHHARMADMSEIQELASEENVEKATADADMAFRIN